MFRALYLSQRSIQGARSLCALWICVVGALSITADVSRLDAQLKLSVGHTEYRSIGGDESHTYVFEAQAGHYQRFDIGRSTVHIVVSVTGPDGTQLANMVCRRGDSFSLSFIAIGTGRYQLSVASEEVQDVRGRYDISIFEDRAGTADDRMRIAAERSFAEGDALAAKWDSNATRLAITKYRTARAAWRGVGDSLGQARALRAIGEAHRTLGLLREAQASFEEAVLLAGSNGRLRAGAAIGSTQTYLAQGEVEKALKRANDALELSRGLRDQAGEAIALIRIGDYWNEMGKRPLELSSYEEALTAARESEAPAVHALALLNIGYASNDLDSEGAEAKARGFFAEALKRFRLLRDLKGEASALAACGQMASTAGDKQQALAYFDHAAKIVQGHGEPACEAPVRAGMAYVYESLGDPGTALETYLKALALWRAAGQRRGEAETLTQLARIYQQGGQIESARSSLLQAQRLLNINDPVQQAFVGIRLGSVYSELGRGEDALIAFEGALKAATDCKSHWIQAQALNGIGDIAYVRGDRTSAVQSYEGALEIARKHDDPFGEVATLVNIARAERGKGTLESARTRLAEALLKIEKLRENLADENLRASYFATTRDAFELTIDVLTMMHLQEPGGGHAASAFDVSESARARSFLDALMRARVDVRQGAEPALLEQEQKLSSSITAQEEKLARLYVGNSPLESALTVERDLRDMVEQRRALTAQMRRRFVERIHPKPLTLSETQRLLDDDTLLLEYAVGERRSFLWAVSSSDVSTYELPGRTVLETAARRFYALQTLTTPEEQLESEATRLGDLFLGPVAALLAQKRLVIVPDGALSYVSFAALSISANQMTNKSDTPGQYRPLIVDHEISYLPSASSLAVVRQMTKHRPPAPFELAVFADPVFDKASLSPPASSSLTASRGNRAALRALRTAMRRDGMQLAGLSRLPSSRREAEAIIAATSGTNVLRAFGVDANLRTLRSANLSQYRIVHFATHGLLDSERPEMSGLVLSLVNAQGQSQNGFLRLPHIYELDLHADLVVLSACETAMGKEIRGEGLVSLTRGFMHAGAARVMASLWKIEDTATADLMGRLYQKMLREGKRPSAALREAQLAMWKQRRWRSPFYWASFVLQGELD